MQNENLKKYLEFLGPVNLFDWVFPIYRGILDKDEFTMKDIGGTAFHIGNNFFMTACHVLDQHQFYNHQKLGFASQITDGLVEVYDFETVEMIPNIDVAILKCEEIMTKKKKPRPFHWCNTGLKYFQTVRAMGYPKGYDQEKNYLHSRAFQGTKVGQLFYSNEILQANCYELSFHCLKGLSGTCLLDANYQIHGIINGNSKNEGYVFKESEVIESKVASTFRVDRLETMYIGIAVQTNEIFKAESKFFDSTFESYFENQGIIGFE